MVFIGCRKFVVSVVLPLGLLLAACESENPGPPQFAELIPVGMLEAAVPPPAPPAPPAPVEAKPTQPPGPAYGGHLASYFRAADAQRGWNIIVRQQSSIGSLKPHIVPIKTPKGPMVRLIAGDFPTREEAERFCTWAHRQHLYCTVMALGPDDQSATPVAASGPPKKAARPRPRAR
jgi:hypothetical protein